MNLQDRLLKREKIKTESESLKVKLKKKKLVSFSLLDEEISRRLNMLGRIGGSVLNIIKNKIKGGSQGFQEWPGYQFKA